MNVEAPTGAMAEIFESYEDGLTEFSEAFQLVDWQVGAVFAINGQVLGLECFGCHDTFKRFFDKLVKSYALDALDSVDTSKSDSPPPDNPYSVDLETVEKIERSPQYWQSQQWY